MCYGQSRLGWSWPRTLDPALRSATQVIALEQSELMRIPYYQELTRLLFPSEGEVLIWKLYVFASSPTCFSVSD